MLYFGGNSAGVSLQRGQVEVFIQLYSNVVLKKQRCFFAENTSVYCHFRKESVLHSKLQFKTQFGVNYANRLRHNCRIILVRFCRHMRSPDSNVFAKHDNITGLHRPTQN